VKPLALIVLVLALAPATAQAKTKWLCAPGLKADPCDMRQDTARYTPDGQLLGRDAPTKPRRRVDCFYVYPTVSGQPTPVANRRIDPEIRSIVRYQAARYANTCRIFAPVYRQVTLAGLANPEPNQRERGYADVRAAWRDYLAHRNRGRGVVLIGHSQGTFHLRELIADEIDDRPRVRRRLVSAILLGGSITVARGRDRGGDFDHVPACRRPTQTRCVVSFATYGDPVPADAIFGRTTVPRREVLCTNPAALGGGEAAIDPILPREPFAPGTAIAALLVATGFPLPASDATWLSFPDSYRARCVAVAGANVLQVTSGPALNPAPTPAWGLHLTDANIALGNLEALVRSQVRAYTR
jgi:pimeloyl-ACP methyl ester carboxylesterase